MKNPSIAERPYVSTPPTESGLRRRRMDLTLDPTLVDIGKKIATEGNVSFSQFMEQLLRSDLEQRGLIARPMTSNRRK